MSKMATKKRLIDANVVFAKQFTAGLSDASGNYYGHADVVLVNDIENAPIVDAVEVKHGRWVDANGIRKSKCGNCGIEFGRVMGDDCHYCPSCGAKMDGDGND